MTNAKVIQQVNRVVSELLAARKELSRLSEEEEIGEKLGLPASAAQIAKVKKLLGKPLPPSYQAFLELHNGWDEFEGDAKILSAEDLNSDWV